MKTITMRDITEVFLNRTGIDFARDKEMRGKILFGADLGIKPRELLQVYMDLSTFNGVIKLVEKTCGYTMKEGILCQN